MGWGEDQAALRTGAAAVQEQGQGAQDCRGEWDRGKAKLLSIQEQLQYRNKALELKTAEANEEGGSIVQKHGLCQVYFLYLGILVG